MDDDSEQDPVKDVKLILTNANKECNRINEELRKKQENKESQKDKGGPPNKKLKKNLHHMYTLLLLIN